MSDRLQEILQLSMGSTPEAMLEKALQTCIEICGAGGGSILGEEGPCLQFLFSNEPALIGVKVPFDSIAGATMRRGVVIYTYAPGDSRHYDGIDRRMAASTRYLLSIPIPCILQSAGEKHGQARNAGALELLFDGNILPDMPVHGSPVEFKVDRLKDAGALESRFGEVLRVLPNIAFGIEVIRLRQTSYQAIHELKNKLIAAISWLEYLEDDIRQRAPALLDDKSVRDDLELVESSMRTGAELAKTYLAFTRIYQPEYKSASVNDVLEQVAGSARAFAQQIGLDRLSVETGLDPSVPARMIDPEKLWMALFNLCKNAVEALAASGIEKPVLAVSSRYEKALEEGGESVPTVLTEGRPPCRPGSKAGVIEMTVRDNGPGMPPEIANNLFIPFKTRKEGGTGLGLTVTKKIVDIHNGTIECLTGPGGTAFIVRI